MPKPTKIFNGKKYTLDVGLREKDVAETLAKNYRKNGHLARITVAASYNINPDTRISIYNVWYRIGG